MDIEKIKDRIAKLLAVATDDAATENEKDVAMRAAHAYMVKYNLEREDIDNHNKISDEFKVVSVPSLWTRMTPWESQIAMIVISHIVKGSFCVAKKEGNTGRNHGTVGQAILDFVGLGFDAEIAAATYVFIRDSLISQCAKKYGSPVRGDGRMYALGFVNGVASVAKSTALSIITLSNATALIRTDMLQAAAKNHYLSLMDGRLKSSSRNISGTANDAYYSGVVDGRCADASQRRPISARICNE